MTDRAWIPDWKVSHVVNLEKKTPYGLYQHECRIMAKWGEYLFLAGVLPNFMGFEDIVGATYAAGTNGNFAIRVPNPELDHHFIITAQGANKGNLAERDFVVVHCVKWEEKEIVVHAVDKSINPSSDALLVARVLDADSRLKGWIHYHRPFGAPPEHRIEISYPPSTESDWQPLEILVRGGVLAIEMIGHDTLRKGGENRPDAAIIIGNDPHETFCRALDFVGLSENKNDYLQWVLREKGGGK